MGEEEALDALDSDPLGVVTHYAISKLADTLSMLINGTGVTIGTVFYVGKEGVLVDQWKALLRILNKGGRGDFFAQSGAALCLANILITACPSQQKSTKEGAKKTPISYQSAVEPLEALVSWITSQLKSSSGDLGLAIPAMTALMNCAETRLLFAAAGGIKYLARHLRSGGKKSKSDKKKSTASVQQLYELTFCLWTMTYELNGSYHVRADFSRDNVAVSALVDLVSTAPREKVVRVALSALRNLAVSTDTDASGPAGSTKIDGESFLNEMIAAGLMKAIDLLLERQWTDPDMVDGKKCGFFPCHVYLRAEAYNMLSF